MAPWGTYVETFKLNGEQIKTVVTSNEGVIQEHLSSFLRPSKNHETKVIGLDTEWSLLSCSDNGPFFNNPKCATLQLCDGQSCLIIQLDRLHSSQSYSYSSSHIHLLNFLSLPNITFVGVGFEKNLAKLERYYGIGCRNTVELGPLAASIMENPRLSACGVDELAFVVNRFDLQEHRPVTTNYDYSCSSLSNELAKLATVNVYSYFKIGSTLLRRGT